MLLISLLPIGNIHAQETPEPPTYVVQPGDTLATIAARFGVSAEDIIAENNIADPNTISVNAELRIPGLDGIQGRISTNTVPLGTTYQQLLKSRQLPEKQFVKLNRITSPAEIVAGIRLLMPEKAENELLSPWKIVVEQQTMLDEAIALGQNPWSMTDINHQNGTWDTLPSEQVFAPEISDIDPLNLVSASITGLEINPLPLTQGQTTVVRITANQPLTISGNLAGHPLNFYQDRNGDYVALQGIYGREEAGLAEFNINIRDADNTTSSYAQLLLVEALNFGKLAYLSVDPALIDPTITEPEDEYLWSIISSITPVQYWDGPFQSPTDDPCINAAYGTSRSYNNGAFFNFHTGVDFGVCAQNLNIYAPAAGVVVFTGPLNVRGNATIIDHGQGVFSGIYHQSEILVTPGTQITPGMLVGLIGNTGRSTGPHLHWDLWVGGVQIDPLEWLDTSFP